jgi:hypothetical protein
MRESLPEIIGGLVVVVIVGIAGLIYTQFPLLVEIAKSIYVHLSPTWLVLATLGILAAGTAAIRIALRRKRGK